MDETGGNAGGCRHTESKRNVADLRHRAEGQQLFDVILIDGKDCADKNTAKRQWHENEFKRKPGHVRHAGKNIKDDPRHHIERRLCRDGGQQG